MKNKLIFAFTAIFSLQAHAFHWRDLWATPDQQGQALMEQKQYQQAQATFENQNWAASAAFKAGDYKQAEALFSQSKTEQGFYNQGNALAHLEQYEQAIKAYDKALALNPADQDAVYNRKLVEELLKKQQNKDQQNKDQQDKDQQNKDQQNKDQQNKDQQGKDQQDKDQQNKDQQDKDQQDKDQQNKDQQNKTNKKPQPTEAQTEADREKQQAKEQWLQLVPDDPGGLLRGKFLRDHIRREKGWNP